MERIGSIGARVETGRVGTGGDGMGSGDNEKSVSNPVGEVKAKFDVGEEDGIEDKRGVVLNEADGVDGVDGTGDSINKSGFMDNDNDEGEEVCEEMVSEEAVGAGSADSHRLIKLTEARS